MLRRVGKRLGMKSEQDRTAVRNEPQRYGNSRATYNHTVLPSTRKTKTYTWHFACTG